MRFASFLLLLTAGCLTGSPPDQTLDAKRACADFEGMTFSASGLAIALAADDADFSAYRHTHADGTVTTGLVQCETRGAATLLYADAAERATGRIDDTSIVWRGIILTAE